MKLNFRGLSVSKNICNNECFWNFTSTVRRQLNERPVL